MKRAFFAILILVGIVWLHPLIVLGMSLLLGLFIRGFYYETIIAGIIFDSIYHTFFHVSFVNLPMYTLLALVFACIVHILKQRLSLYA